MVSLVLLFMMSIMGIQAMRSASLDRRMSTNAVHKSVTFQAAESATELALDNMNSLSAAITSGLQVPVTVPVTLNDDEHLDTNASVQYTGRAMALGWGNNFAAFQFEVIGDAALGDVNAKTNIVQGAFVAAPANN